MYDIDVINNENKTIPKSENVVSIVSFNLLSSEYFKYQVYKSSPSSIFKWNTRKQELRKMIESFRKDIMCFQVFYTVL